MDKLNYRGFTIEVKRDDYAESPDALHDNDIFAVGWHNEFFVERGMLDKNLFGAFLGVEGYEDYKPHADKVKKDYHVFMLEAYIHSGVSLAIADHGKFSNRKWDVSSNVGAVLVSKKEAKTCTEAKKRAQSLIETWNDYLSGNVYCYSVDAINDSCYGFYGYDHEKSGLLDTARDNIDGYIKEKINKHVMTRKQQIKNHVPLEKRVQLTVSV